MKEIKCPECGRCAVFSSENPYRPFCSKRCKMVDLGAWASEKYFIEGQTIYMDEENER